MDWLQGLVGAAGGARALLGVPLVLGYTALIYKVFAGKVKDSSTAGY